MQLDRNHPAAPGDDRGFALIVVIWIVGLLALIAASFTGGVRSHIRSVAGVAEGARAEAMADAGANLAILDLVAVRLDPRRARRFALGGEPTSCALEGAGVVTVTLQDESGRVDLNAADERLLAQLLTGLGAPAEAAATVAASIADFRDADGERRARGAELADYLAAGLARGPKNAPFDAVEELDQVLGLDGELASRLKPFVTVYSGQAGIDLKSAPPALRSALASGTGGTPDAGVMLASPAAQRVFLVRSEAVEASGARFVREAVVALGGSRTRPWSVKRWVRGGRSIGQTPSAGDLAGC